MNVESRLRRLEFMAAKSVCSHCGLRRTYLEGEIKGLIQEGWSIAEARTIIREALSPADDELGCPICGFRIRPDMSMEVAVQKEVEQLTRKGWSLEEARFIVIEAIPGAAQWLN
jgi:DNA-directed RNA polymerase subunit RPC12/RpoP